MSEVSVLSPPSPEAVRGFIDGRTADVEKLVRERFATHLGGRFPAGLALVSVGGFGRRELFPHSDVDLMLLIASDKQIPPREFISAFLQSLWDSNLRPSHSVHTVEDCVTEHSDNVELTISLLDHRYLAGDETLYRTLDEKFRAFIKRRGESIARQLAGLAEGRRAKYQKTIYHLEPNIKETPGALRDLQIVRWLTMLASREAGPDLTAAFEFFAAVRLRLHEMDNRDQNVLSFDAQEALSEEPASLMRTYYRHARLVDRTAREAIEAAASRPGSMLGRFHDWRSRLSTTEYSVIRDRVLLRVPMPPKDLSLFEFVARHGLHLAPSTVERIQGFKPNATWEDWRRLLTLPKPSPGLRAMQDSGVMAAVLPEWRNIECLVVRDFYHRYTVDEHTLVAIESLENITDGRFRELFHEIENPVLIRMALLLHDIGKGSGRDHTEVSVEVSRDVLGRLGAPEADRETIEFLVQHHLELSSVMNARDLFDGGTARMLADRIGTLERLRLLTMVTYADISAVNPQAMTPWRQEQLFRVFLMAHDELTRELESERIHDAAGMPPEKAAFLEGLPTRYLRTHSAADIDAHMQMARQLESRPVAIEIVHERGVYRLTLLTKDRPALFASVAAAISSFGLNIVKVEAFSNHSGIVVDTFTFADPHRTLELNPPEVDRLRGIVRRVVEGRQDADRLLKSRPKPLLPSRKSRLKPRVAFNNEVSASATLVEIVAEDRPGLLYDLAHTFSESGCNIEVVLIDTEAHKALDVFYVTSEGKKLSRDLESRLKANLEAVCSVAQ